MKAQTFIDKRTIYLRRKSGNGAKSRQKRSFKGWFAEFVLTRKKVCAHERKQKKQTGGGCKLGARRLKRGYTDKEKGFAAERR